MDKPRQSIREIFDAASDLSDLEQRTAFVAKACGHDEALHRRVLELLRAHDTAGGFLRPATDRREPLESTDLGERIGSYRVIEKIGSGGYGDVYLAEQQEPVRRRVALKVIKPGMDTRSVIARFETERQALAMMDHPNIARVFDAGATRSGRPYFVMELVQGIRITDFCDKQPLSTKGRLEMFIQVCHAVQHAHQKGVIHRDIKPSNILVSLHDGVAVPKVIDFGIAKPTAALQLTDKTLFTHPDQFLGTPSYMSPEQALGGSADIDTRSDIYSLGVLLYELLTGRPPFDGETLLRSGLDRLRHTICESEPMLPSTQLRQLDPGQQSLIAGFRSTDPDSLVAALRGDLDWIVLKALEKDRTRRYESAGSLAVEVQRHLDDEPVLARPPSKRVLFQKFVRRNRTFFYSVLASAVALIVGLGVATFLFFEERAARQRAVLAERTQSTLRMEAEAARKLALEKTEESRLQLVRLNLSTGTKLMADDDYHAALLWFAEALRLDQGDPVSEEIHRRRIAAVEKFAPRLKLIVLLGSYVFQAAFTPDSQRVVGIGEEGITSVWDIHTGELLADHVPYSLDLYRTDRFPAATKTVSHDSHPPAPQRTVRKVSDDLVILDVATGGELARFRAPTNDLYELSVSLDLKRVLGVSGDGNIFRWEAPFEKPLPVLKLSPRFKLGILSQDGLVFAGAAGKWMRDLGVWDFQTGKRLLEVKDPVGDMFDCQLSPDAKLVAVAGWEGVGRVFDVASGQPAGDALHHARGVGRTVFSPDGARLVTSSWDTTARLWDPKTGRPLSPRLHHAGYVPVAGFSQDGKLLLTGGQDQTIRIWDVSTGTPARLSFNHGEGIAFAKFSPTGDRIVTGGGDRRIVFWKRDSGEASTTVRLSFGASIAAFSPDGARLAVGGTHGEVEVLEVATGISLLSFSGHSNNVTSLMFSPDGRHLLTASLDGTAAVWNSRDGRAGCPKLRHGGPVRHAEFDREGQRVVTASEDATARIWDALSGHPIGKDMRHDCGVRWAAFSPDGKRIATAETDNSQLARNARIWDATTQEHASPPMPHRDGVIFSIFSPDGRFIATGGEDTTSVIWDATTGAAITKPLPHTSYVWQAAFSPDSRMLMTASMDRTARIWDVQSGEPITPPLKQDTWVMGGDWSPDGREVLTFGKEGQVRVWDLSPTSASLDEIQQQAELLSAHRLKPGFGITPLSTQEILYRWKASRRQQ